VTDFHTCTGPTYAKPSCACSIVQLSAAVLHALICKSWHDTVPTTLLGPLPADAMLLGVACYVLAAVTVSAHVC
jgi:hypothetical protein